MVNSTWLSCVTGTLLWAVLLCSPAYAIDAPLTASEPSTSQTGQVFAYYYDDIGGMNLSDLSAATAFPDQPTEVVAMTELARLGKRGKDFGMFVRGYVVPPVSGEYEFFLSSDDESRLFLSTTALAENLREIAHVPRWTNKETYDQFSSQRSGPLALTGGERYYFELLHKQSGGGDHFSVAWQGPGLGRQTVPGQYLASWVPPDTGDADGGTGGDTAAGTDAETFGLGYRTGFFDGQQGLSFNPGYPPLDEDQDGLYDNWEAFYGLDPQDPSDATLDTDGDLLTAEEEFMLGTNPANPDTSGDGLTDGEKYAYGLNPLDPDDLYVEIDGEMVNLYDYLYGSNEGALDWVNGFVGHYFATDRFTEFAFTRLDPAIDFGWGSGSPSPEIPSDWFAIRWFAQIYPPHASGVQTYQLNMRGDDGVRAWLDGEQVLDGWKAQAATTYSTLIKLDAAQAPYALVAEYYEAQFGATVQLWLSNPDTGEVLDTTEVFRRPDLALTDQTALVDTDADGIPDVWELSYGLNPWQDDAASVYNDQSITSLEAYEQGVHPWTLEEVSEPVDSGTLDPGTSQPDSGTVTLTWTAPSTRTDGSSISLSEIRSYRILYGQATDTLDQQVEATADATQYTFEGLAAGTWYFQIQVVDTDGLVSPGSDIVSATIE